jgi:RHS repeat-associated protein
MWKTCSSTLALVPPASPTVSQLTWDTEGPIANILSDDAFDYAHGPMSTPVEAIALSSSTPTYLTFTPGAQTWVATNEAGDLVSFWGYDAFGTLAFGTPSTPFGFAGQYTDATTGFSNLRARFYDAASGGFTTRDPAFASTDTAYDYAGDDPVNESDPLGLWGWNPISDVTQVAGDVGHYVVTHKKGIEIGVGVGLGALAAATGVGAIVEGSVLLAGVSVAAGLGASALDYGPCVNGDNTACVGLSLGLTGAVAGGFGLAGAGLVAGGIIAEDSTAAAILGGLGAFGWNVGIAGTILDATTGIASAASLCGTER